MLLFARAMEIVYGVTISTCSVTSLAEGKVVERVGKRRKGVTVEPEDGLEVPGAFCPQLARIMSIARLAPIRIIKRWHRSVLFCFLMAIFLASLDSWRFCTNQSAPRRRRSWHPESSLPPVSLPFSVVRAEAVG